MNDYNEFYRIFREKLEENKSIFPVEFQIPNHQNNRAYIGYNSGKTKIDYYTEYTSRGYGQGCIGFAVGVFIGTSVHESYQNRLHKLQQHKDVIEATIGEKLHWIDTGKAGRIFFLLEEDFDNIKNWDSTMNWEIEKLAKLIPAFQKYIRALQ